MNGDVYQVMPPLTTDELAALEADVVTRGIVVPVVVDQRGRLLDGHHRRQIAARHGIACPVEVHHVADDEDARQTALALNLARRHMTREQRRELIARECAARPQDSDREIARRLGCSATTVGAVRRPVSKLDTPEVMTESLKENLIANEREIQAALDVLDDALVRLPRLDAIRLLTKWWRTFEERAAGDEEFRGPVRRHLHQPRLDLLLTVVA